MKNEPVKANGIFGLSHEHSVLYRHAHLRGDSGKGNSLGDRKSSVSKINQGSKIEEAKNLSLILILGSKAQTTLTKQGEKSILAHEGVEKLLEQLKVEAWQIEHLKKSQDEQILLATERGRVWILRPTLFLEKGRAKLDHAQSLSPFALFRDQVGRLWNEVREQIKDTSITIKGMQLKDDEAEGALVGIELAQYRFISIMKRKLPQLKIAFDGFTRAQIQNAAELGFAVNLARHLVNVDSGTLNPKTYAFAVRQWFDDKPGVSVDVWDHQRLKKERMNLHLAVGQAGVEKSHMVHIKYRPKGALNQGAPIAVVGKGVTFDSGGLDIKPPSGMRLMKKDMGGSASVVGIAEWVISSQYPIACDFYLGLAENAIDAHAMRPGDIIMSRAGIAVEIHNTDAEGRLVLADVLDVAQSSTEKPMFVLDLATLTGAMRVAVGAEIAGYFSNDEKLSGQFQAASEGAGDHAWRLPLWQSYRSQLRSTFADMSNASDSGFAGAITAALFLERFIKPQTKWLHVDLFCWADRLSGGFGEIGGNGQGVQLFSRLMNSIFPLKKEPDRSSKAKADSSTIKAIKKTGMKKRSPKKAGLKRGARP